ncbi:MAG: hypothetical protein ACM3ST_10565 [Bdellovibrio bacteriovorus]
MARQTHDGDSNRADGAFNRVLAAEARAREEVEGCRKQAAAILAAAEEQARYIASRADRRVRRAHRIADAGVERALAELLTAGTEAEQGALEGEALKRLDRAIEALVAEILRPDARSGTIS